MVFGGAAAVEAGGARGRIRRRLDPITLLAEPPPVPAPTPRYWGNGRATLVLVTLADAAGLQRDPARARPRPLRRASSAPGPSGCSTSSGRAPRSTTSTCSSFAFRLPGRAEPDAPAMIDRDRRRLPRADPLRRRADRHPHRHRAEGARPRRRQPRRGPARGALRRAGQPQARARAGRGSTARRDEAHRRAFRLLSDLKHALDAEGQLELHYQPKVTLDTGACASAEALLRWTHPQLGPVSPGEFVELAETTALVTPMTRWVIDAATRQAAIWQREGLDLDDRGQRLAEEPRGAGLRRVPAVLLRRAPARPRADRARGHRGGQRRARRADPRPAGGAAQPRLLDRDRRLRLGLLQHELPDPAVGARAEDRPEPGARGARPTRSAAGWSRTSCRWAATSATASSPRASRPKPSGSCSPAGAATTARAGTSAGRCRRAVVRRLVQRPEIKGQRSGRTKQGAPQPARPELRPPEAAVSAWRTGSCGAPCACRTSCARRRGCRGSGSPRPSAPGAGSARRATAPG